MPKLPPLNALRAFECAARWRSFTEAASELHVSPSAVSRHVMQLESWLGVPLFSRSQRRIELTETGADYAREATAVFSMLERATRQAKSRVRPELRFVLAPTVAFRWLVPRITQFQKQFPSVAIQISTSLAPVDLEAGEADVEVRAYPEPPDHLHATWIFDSELIAVCKPGYLDPVVGLEEQLKNVPMLISQSRSDDWATWLASSGVNAPEARATLAFEYSFMAYEAAAEGGGVAIAVRSLVEDDLASGRLVHAHPAVVATGQSYFAASVEGLRSNTAVNDFHAWLEGRVRAERAAR
jgi:LysR family glycine cleavage system transcriptional activator